jgi:DNA-binding SARP family transcriptional activator
VAPPIDCYRSAVSELRFSILGPVRAWLDGREVDLGPGKQRAVLAVLLLEANAPVPAGKIVDAVWGERPPENGVNVVQKYVAGLRRILEPDRSPRSPGRLLTLDDAGYRLAVAPESLDTAAIATTVRAGLAARAEGRLPDAAAVLRRALDGWVGEPLAGLGGATFDAARIRLADRRAEAWEALADVESRLGHDAALVADLTSLVAEFPVREGLRYHLMLALHRAGRRAEALEAFRDARRYLVDEYGVEPGERLQELQRRILREQQGPRVPHPRAEPGPLPGPASHPEPATRLEPASRPEPASHLEPASALAPTAAEPLPEPAPRRAGRVFAVLGAAAVPLLSFGALAWASMLYFAARRHSRALTLVAAGYLAVLVTAFASFGPDPEVISTRDSIATALLLALAFGGAGHAAYLAYTAPYRRGAIATDDRRARRAEARRILRFQPRVAEDLRIGRPDLPRWFDDGGLVDVNAVPERTLAALPGVGAHRARLIVQRRPLTSAHDLVAEGIVTAQVARRLDDVLVYRTSEN